MSAVLPKPQAEPAVVLTKATVRAAELLGLNSGDLARVIGVSAATVSRYRQAAAGLSPASKSGQLALLLVRVFRSLDPLVGSDAQKRHDWLRSHNKALNGTPAALIENPTGLVNALAYLDGMRAAA